MTWLRVDCTDNWTRDAYPPEGGDARKIVTLHKDGMIWVGIRAYDGARWLNNGRVDPTEKVLAWQPLPTPAYSDGMMSSMSGPTLPAGDG